MNKKILLIGASLLFTTALHAQQWGGTSFTPAIPTFTDGDASIGTLVHPGDAKLFITDIEDPTLPGTSHTSFRIKRDFMAGPYNFAHYSGNLMEAITQSAPAPPEKKFVLTSDFRMGIGTDNPGDRLNVHNGNFSLTQSNDANPRNVFSYTNAGSLNLFANTAVTNGPAIELKGRAHSSTPGEIRFTNYDRGYFVFGKWHPGLSLYERQVVIGDDGNINMNRWNDGTPRIIFGNTQTQSLCMYSNGGWNDGANLELYGPAHTSLKGQVRFISRENGDLTNVGFDFITCDGANNNSTVRIHKDGKMVIGNVAIPIYTNAGAYDYKLYVERGILTERVKVALHNTSDWADYVFAEDYNLKSLDEVEAFIDANKHLPGVPSAKDVVAEGIDVAKMDATLLQKVEELTLYIIEQNKRIALLEKELNKSK